jgi:hypothetical protein
MTVIEMSVVIGSVQLDVNLFFELLSTLDAVGLGVRLCDLGEVG